MKRREFTKSTAASVALSPLSQIDTEADSEQEEEEVEILFRMSRERLRRLEEKGEVYKIEPGIWRFISEEHSEYGGEAE